MPCNSTSQLTNAQTVPVMQTMPQNQAQWSIFAAQLQGILSAIANAANKTGVNVLPSAYALYDSAALPSMTITGATASLDSSTVQFGNASLKLVATAATVSVSFTGFPVPITPFQRWIVSVFAQSSRSAITGTLAVVTPETSYPVNIDGNLLAGTWGRLYGDCSLTSDDSSGCTVTLTLTGCSVGDVYHFDGWQLEQANGTTDLPSAFVCSGAPASQDALPDGSTYVRLDGSHAAGNVAYNYRGVWAAGTAYVTGDETVYAGTYWLATAGSTGSAPGSSGAPWQAVGAYNDYTGAWSATTAYLPGQEVTYAGNFWVCALANSNSAPAVGNANWAMAGPQSLQNIADGTSRFAVVNAGGLNAVASVDTNQRALIDFSQSAHLYRSQDYIPDGTSYGRAPLTYGTSQALTIPNADFSAPLDPQGNIPGLLPTSSASLLPVSAGQPPYTKNCLLISAAGASGSFGGANGQEKIPCASGDYLSGSIMIWPDNATVAGAGYSFYDGAGTALGAVDVNATAGTSWQLYNFGGIAPANTAYASRTYYVESTGSATYAGFSTMRATLNDLRVAGSGTQIGDQRNLLPITFGGVRSVLSASPITYTITPGSPTSGLVFSVAAVSLYAGSVTINYAASSASHTQTNGTSANWFLYYVDPTMSGGSLPLQATANPNGPAQTNGAVLLGVCTVTVASGGGGSGGSGSGGGGYCVADDMFIRLGKRAGGAVVGDEFDCIDLPTQAGKHVRTLRGVSRGIEECVRIITADGCALTCSLSTPFDTPDGRTVLAARMLGEYVVTDLHDQALVVSTALVGQQPVTRAHLGGVSYAAGADPTRRIYSHNVSTQKP